MVKKPTISNILDTQLCIRRIRWKKNYWRRRLARQFQKNLIHIPTKRFSNQTLEHVRSFHVLNNKDNHSFAQRFIQDI